MTEEKNKNFEKLIRPNTFYCTFENEIAVQKAVEIQKFQYEDTEMELHFKAAKEPSNIIWQNRGISKNQRKKRLCLISTVMLLMGVVFFVISTKCIQQMLMIKYFRNPPGVECSKLVEVYGDSLAQMASAELYHFE